MNGRKLQQTARRAADALPGSGSGRPFTEKLDVYKVAGKVFLIVTDDPGERIITVKAEPEHGRRLRDQYSSITAGRYLDKKHWISVGSRSGCDRPARRGPGHRFLRPRARLGAPQPAAHKNLTLRSRPTPTTSCSGVPARWITPNPRSPCSTTAPA